jgi:hypothetical protein
MKRRKPSVYMGIGSLPSFIMSIRASGFQRQLFISVYKSHMCCYHRMPTRLAGFTGTSTPFLAKFHALSVNMASSNMVLPFLIDVFNLIAAFGLFVNNISAPTQAANL